MTKHPTPWRVEYHQRLKAWHPQSRPYIVDAVGVMVCQMIQNVEHPGLYDQLADETAQKIVEAVNRGEAPRKATKS